MSQATGRNCHQPNSNSESHGLRISNNLRAESESYINQNGRKWNKGVPNPRPRPLKDRKGKGMERTHPTTTAEPTLPRHNIVTANCHLLHTASLPGLSLDKWQYELKSLYQKRRPARFQIKSMSRMSNKRVSGGGKNVVRCVAAAAAAGVGRMVRRFNAERAVERSICLEERGIYR